MSARKFVSSVFAMVIALSTSSGIALAEITFEPFREFETNGPSPWQIEAADMDGDGFIDLIVGGGYEIVSVMAGDGNGNFGAPVAIEADFPWYELSGLTIADVDADGDTDIVTSRNLPLPGTIPVFLNDGVGSFVELPQNLEFPNDLIFHLRSADFNNDDYPDLVVIGATAIGFDSHLYIVMNDGGGLFDLGQGLLFEDVRLAVIDTFDMDADGDVDIILGSGGSPDIRVMQNDGFGNFELWLTYTLFDEMVDVEAMGVGDLNGDLLGDILAVGYGYHTLVQTSCNVFEYLSETEFGSLIYKEFINLGDLNGDGFSDLTAAITSLDFMQGGVAVHQNDGLGNFAYVNHWWTSENPPATEAHIVVDLDLDGDNDIAALNEGVETVGVLLNTTIPEAPPTPPCYADTNSDGSVDPLDAGFVLSQFGCDPCLGNEFCVAADVNRDAMVDPLDAGFVLSRFGDCL